MRWEFNEDRYRKKFCSIEPVTAIALVGGASAGASIFSGIFGASASKKQGDAIRYSADVARTTALELDTKARADVAPFREYGVKSGDILSKILGGEMDLDTAAMGSSLFKWEQAEGERALNRQLSARGMFGSGAGLETLARFNAQLVGEEGIRYWDRLFNTTTMGANAAAHMATNTSATGRSLADITMRGGIAEAESRGDVLRSIGSIGPGVGRAIAGGIGDYYFGLPMWQTTMNAINRYGSRGPGMGMMDAPGVLDTNDFALVG